MTPLQHLISKESVHLFHFQCNQCGRERSFGDEIDTKYVACYSERLDSYHLEVLRAHLAVRQRKNHRYSHRAYALFLGLHPSALSRVLTKKMALSNKSSLVIVRKLELNTEERRLFLQSVVDAAYRLNCSRLGSAIGASDPNEIAARLNLSPEATSNALQALLDSGLLQKDGQLQGRGHYDLTMATDPGRIQEANRRIAKFVEDLCEFLGMGNPSEVYQVGVQLYPLSRPLKEKP